MQSYTGVEDAVWPDTATSEAWSEVRIEQGNESEVLRYDNRALQRI